VIQQRIPETRSGFWVVLGDVADDFRKVV